MDPKHAAGKQAPEALLAPEKMPHLGESQGYCKTGAHQVLFLNFKKERSSNLNSPQI